MTFKIQDFRTMLAAARLCRDFVRDLSTTEQEQRGIAGLPDVLRNVISKVKTARRIVWEAKQRGITTGVVLLSFAPQEWWALWHALSCWTMIMDDADNELSRQLEPVERKRRRRSATRLRHLVNEILHDPALPGHCTCREEKVVPSLTPRPPHFNPEWN